jgi:hypothetical protein
MHQLPKYGAIRVPFHRGTAFRLKRRSDKHSETELVCQKRKRH